MRYYRGLIALLCVVAGCSDATSTRNLLFAMASENELLLRNESNTPVAVFVIEQDALANTDFVLCQSPVPKPTDCGAIQPGETRHVPNANIFGYKPGGNAVVIERRLVFNPLTHYYDPRDGVSIVIKLR